MNLEKKENMMMMDDGSDATAVKQMRLMPVYLHKSYFAVWKHSYIFLSSVVDIRKVTTTRKPKKEIL